MSDIVEEIIIAGKIKIQEILTDTFKELFYANNLALNDEGKLEKRFGFLPLDADFVEGRAMQFITMDQDFSIILTDEVISKDSDTALQDKTNKLYFQAHEILRNFKSCKLDLPTPTNQILIISGSSFEKPEILGDNIGVALRLKINIQYRFKNVC